MYICMTAHGWPQMASDHTTSQEEIMTSQKNHSLHGKKTMNYDFRVHTLFHKDFSVVLFEDKIIEKPYGVFIYTSYGCSTSCCLWNIMWFSLCETWRQREFALKKFHSHEIFAEENIASTASMFGLCVITLYQRPVIEKFRIFYQPWDIHLQYPSKFGLVWFGR